MGDPVPRAAAAIKEVHAATEAVEKAMVDYRRGGSVSAVNRANDRLAKAHYRHYIVEAGRMVGLGRNAAYAAAAAGKIPVMEFGALKIVPKLQWLRQIGADDAAVAARPSKATA